MNTSSSNIYSKILPRNSIYADFSRHNNANDDDHDHIGNEQIQLQNSGIQRSSHRDRGSSSLLGMLNPYGRQSSHYQRVNEVVPEEGEDYNEDEDDVPQSLMMEVNPSRNNDDRTPLESTPDWQTRIRNLSPHRTASSRDSSRSSRPRSSRPTATGLPPHERAMWKWANVENLDTFLQEVYSYYVGKGMYCIVLSRVLNLLTVGFVIIFSTFLLGCLDYSKIRHGGKLADIVQAQCISRLSGFASLFLFIFSVFWVWQVIRFYFEFQRLRDMYSFYTLLLNIPDVDVQTISWPEVVNRIIAIRDNNPTTSNALRRQTTMNHNQRLDAHDIANRIMREENYLIALFNKDILNLSIPLPLLKDRPFLTKTLEWNLSFCLLGFLFDDQGQVRRHFTRDAHRQQLIEGLRRRFIFMGFINMIFAPFIVGYLLLYYFFRYFEEYHKNPGALGSRQFTRFATWKFRDFNELPHLFEHRLSNAYTAAIKYVDQFPKEKTTIITRFVSFIAGSFAAVLVLASVVDPDLFLNFEITQDRNVFFYIGVFGAILAVSRGIIADEKLIFEPEAVMRQVVEHTHYLPDEWIDKLHSDFVHREFANLFQYKVTVFAQELLSVIFTPLVLWYSLPECSPAIIDFLREFTVHVDGIGYVCSFAVFDFKRHGNVRYGAPLQAEDERYQSKEGKMEQSFLNFKANHPDWIPSDPVGSVYLQKQRQRQKRSAMFSPPQVPAGASSIMSPPPMAKSMLTHRNPIPETDGHFESNLGDSYDSTTAAQPNAHHDDVDIQDGKDSGVLGMLNQIYDLNTKHARGMV